MSGPEPDAPRRSAWMVRAFGRYAEGYVARHVHAVRLARGGYRPGGGDEPGGPVVVMMNHPSWWDPLTALVLARRLWPGRASYAPIDAQGLARYPFLGRVGLFGVEPGTARGAREFLRRSAAVLADPGSVLWVTAQGRFADPRERPVCLKRGVGHLAHRLRTGSVVPLALEYPFWEERTPEALARFGPPVVPGSGPGLDPDAWTDRLARALEETQNALAADALSRDPTRFETLLTGRAGVGGVYDLWRRLRATARGRRFDPRHAGGPEKA